MGEPSIKDELMSQRRRTPCGVRTFLHGIDRELKIEYLEALQESRISASALSAHMAKNDEKSLAPSVGTIKRHRRGECSCDD